MQHIASLIDVAISVGVGLYLTVARKSIVAKIDSPERRAKADKVLMVCGPLIIAAGLMIAFTRIPSIGDPAERYARRLNETTPKMIDAVTRFDGATAEPGKRVVVKHTVTNAKASDVNRVAWDIAVPLIRQRFELSSMARLPKEGITVVYRYSGSDGKLIDDVVFVPPSKK